jgi:hypothetical protein
MVLCQQQPLEMKFERRAIARVFELRAVAGDAKVRA